MIKSSKWVRFMGIFTVFAVTFSFAIVAFSPTSEARISFGERIRRHFEDNIVRSIDRIQRAYADDYVDSTRDRLRIKRYSRNQILKELYAVKYEAKYRPEIIRYTTRSSEISEASRINTLSPREREMLDVINSHLESGEAIQPRNYNERRIIAKLCKLYGIPYSTKGSLIYVSK